MKTAGIVPAVVHKEEVVDSTKFKLAMEECLRKYYWRHERHIVPIAPRLPLEFGIAWHRLMAEHYRGGDIKKCLAAFMEHWTAVIEDYEEDDKRNSLRAGQMYNSYRESFPLSSEPFQILGVEMPFAIPLKLESSWLIWSGIIDLAVKYSGFGFAVVDHKTTSSLAENFWTAMNPNTQFTGYILAMNRLFPKEKCAGLYVNAALMHKTKFGFERRPTNRWAHELAVFEAEVAFFWEHVILNCRKKNEWPKNTNSCTKWGSNNTCEYLPLCTHVGRDYRKLEPSDLSYRVEEWKPLEEVR